MNQDDWIKWLKIQKWTHKVSIIFPNIKNESGKTNFDPSETLIQKLDRGIRKNETDIRRKKFNLLHPVKNLKTIRFIFFLEDTDSDQQTLYHFHGVGFINSKVTPFFSHSRMMQLFKPDEIKIDIDELRPGKEWFQYITKMHDQIKSAYLYPYHAFTF